MAESKIKGGFERFTPTLKNGASVESWGWTHGVRFGQIVMITVWGLKMNRAISADTAIMEIPFNSIEGVGTLSGFDNYTCNLVTSGKDISITSQVNPNNSYFGQIIIFIDGQ